MRRPESAFAHRIWGGYRSVDGEKAIMADAMESFWKDVDQEAPDELMNIEDHDFVAFRPFSSIILPGEGDSLVVDADQSSVSGGDPVDIAGEIGVEGGLVGTPIKVMRVGS